MTWFQKVLFVAVSSILVFAACSKKGSEGIDVEGLCTEATIEANNVIVQAVEKRDGKSYLTSDIEKLKAAEAQCLRFSNLVGVDSCTASSEENGTAVIISVEKNRLLCEAVRKVLNGESVNELPKTADEAAISKLNNRPLREFATGLTLQVKEFGFNKYPRFLLQEGKIVHSAGQLNPTKNYCDVKVTKRIPIERNIPAAITFGEAGEVAVSNLSFGVSMQCFKRTTPTPWLVEDLKKTFGAAVSVFFR